MISQKSLKRLAASMIGTCVAVTLMAATASADIVYHDGFGRTGNLVGSAPDVVNTNGNLWEVGYGGTYTTNGTTAGQSAGNYGEVFLPVNGSSGVTLDGTDDFTLSVVATVNTTTATMGIALNTAKHNTGSQFNGNQTGIYLSLGANTDTRAIAADSSAHYSGYGTLPSDRTIPSLLAIAYDASAGTLTCTADSTVVYTKPGVVAADIAALNYVSLDTAYNTYRYTGTFDDFKLEVVPEPATLTLLAASGLMMLRRRRA